MGRKRAVLPLAKRIRAMRDACGISARELDRLAGLGLGHTNMIEVGSRPNNELKTLERIASVFGVSLDWLVRGHGQPPTQDALRVAVEAARITIPKAESA